MNHVLVPTYGATGLGYRAAEVVRNNGRAQPAGGGPDSHLRYDFATIRNESQRLERDNGIYCGVLSRCVDNTIGDGFGLQAMTDNRAQNDRIESLWSEWCDSPEVREDLSWHQLEQLALLRLLVDGDFGAVMPDLPYERIQAVESERIGGTYPTSRRDGAANIELGVELDSIGRRVAFWIYPYESYGTSSKGIRIPAANMAFIANLQFPSQTRGAPCGQAAFPMLHRINDVCDSEALAWQILSRYAVVINRPNAAELSLATSAANDAADSGDLDQRIHKFRDGIMFHAEPGETIAPVDRDLPGANFPNSITMFLRLLGLPFGLPLELLLLDWSKTNYSSARAALEQAYRRFKTLQLLLCRRWHTPIFRWKVSQWVAQGRLRNIGSIYNHVWRTAEFPWLDQLKEAQAWGARVDRGFSTFGEALKSVGRDRETTIAMRQREVAEAIEAADTLNERYADKLGGAKVPWQMFAGMEPTVAAQAITVESDNGDGGEQADDAAKPEE